MGSEKHCHVGMGNLCMLAKFARAACIHPTKALLAGAARKGMRGLPRAAVQEEEKSKVVEMEV